MRKSISYYAFLGGLSIAFLSSFFCGGIYFLKTNSLDFQYILAYFMVTLIISYLIVLAILNSFSKKPSNVKNGNQKIKHLNNEQYRRDFLGNISHEMKTPLFAVQSYILILLEEDSLNPVIYKKYLERASLATERLEAIFKDLDMIYKLESDSLDLKPIVFDIRNLIQKVFDMLEITALKKNISLNFEKFYEFPEYVFADKQKIEQVLTNLIINAIKYGKPGGYVIVGIHHKDLKNNCIVISDNGIGIAEKHLPRIFERFYRVEKSRSRQAGGSGLGLSIVKHILEAHEKNISVKSQKGKGSTFSFCLSVK